MSTAPMRVLIVEDEALQRRALEQMVRQAAPGAAVSASADGLDALAQAERQAPDAVFMDIRMPRMDGIAAAKRMREIAPDASIFFLTAYEHFAYAQQAVGLGAGDYLVKPVAPADLQRCLAQAQASLSERQSAERQQAELRRMLADAIPLLRAELARDLCSGAITSPAAYRQRAGVLEVSGELDLAVSIGFGPGELEPAAPRGADGQDGQAAPAARVGLGGQPAPVTREIEAELRRRQAAAAVEEIIASAMPGAVVARVAHDEIVVLVPGRELRASGRRPWPSLRRLLARVMERCQGAGLQTAIGIGSQVSGPLALWRSYRAAVRARQRAWLMGTARHRVVQAADLGDEGEHWHRYPLLAERGLAEAVRSGLAAQASDYLAQLMSYFAGAAGDRDAADPQPTGGPGGPAAGGATPPPAAARSRAIECLALLARAANEGGVPADQVLAASARSLDRAMLAASGEELAGVVAAGGQSLAELVAGHQQQRQSGLAARAVAYLEGHFPEEVSLTALAEHLHISPFYLSHIFRQSVGITFSEYLARVRIEEAKRLLRSTDLPVGEVAARAGYREPNYFGRVFKRVTGHTPIAWRRGR
jgi:two-component system response regulator YesN